MRNINKTLHLLKLKSIQFHSLSVKKNKLECGEKPDTTKTGEHKARLKSVDDNVIDKHVNGWIGANSKSFQESQSDESLRHDLYRLKAKRRLAKAEMFQVLEMFRAYCASLPDEEKERYSKHPPILVMGGSYLMAMYQES